MIEKRFTKVLHSVVFFMMVFCICISVSCAQENNTALRFKGGIIGGMNATQVDGDDYAGYHKFGFNAGFTAEMPLSQKWFTSAEILYSQLGSRSALIQNQPIAFQLNLDYAEIPVLINFQDKENINFGAGISYGRLVSSKKFINQDEQQGPIDGLKRDDFRVIANGSYFFTEHFAFNARFSYSFIPMAHFYSPLRGGDTRVYNNVVTLRFMWIF